MKQYIIYLAILSSCFLIGCSNSKSNKQIVHFDNFYIEIEDTFHPVPSGMVENKQLLNKVIKSFKKDSKTGFDTNFLITKSPLPPSLDYEQFWTVNTNKLKQYVQGYQANEKMLLSFECGEEEITGIYVSFSVKDSFMQKTDMYYMAQYQFVTSNNGYILSYATDESKDRKRLEKKLDTLTCTDPTQ